MKKVVLWLSLTLSFPSLLLSATEFDDGLSLFQSGDYDRAYTVFNRLFENGDTTKDLDFFLGRSAFEIEKYNEALFAFDRVLIEIEGIDKIRENRTKLELARTHIALNEIETGKKLLKEVLASEPPESVEENIEKLLISLEKPKEMKKHTLQLFANISVGLEENVNSQPQEERLKDYYGNSGLKGDRVDSLYVSETANIFYGYNFNKNFSINTNLFGYNQNYSDDSDYDITYLSAQLSPAFRSEEKYRVELPMKFDTVTYGGEPLLNSYSGGLKVSKVFDTKFFQNLAFTILTNYKAKDYDSNFEDNRTGDSSIFEYGLGVDVRNRTHILSFQYSTEFEKSNEKSELVVNSNQTDKIINNIRLHYTFLNMANILDFRFSYSFRNVVYDDYEAFSNSSESDGCRKDRYHNFGFKFGREVLFEGLTINLGYNRVINNSNHLPVSYTKNIYNFGVNYRY
jgi:hypothetical protein